MPRSPRGRPRRLRSFPGRAATVRVIEGVLHKPVGFQSGRKYPLLVVIHGGPTGVSRPTPFSSTSIYPIDLWVAKGALVLEPNYRGSAGYGEQFRALNVRNLGVGDAWDVLSGVDYLIAQGMADPDRVGTMGWSQGGYISAFLTTHDSARFKAVSVGAGISDWMTYYVNTDIHPFTRQYLKATPWEDPEIYAKTSPITYIKGAKAPTLIQHGATDQRVPLPNAYELYQGLAGRRCADETDRLQGIRGRGPRPVEAEVEPRRHATQPRVVRRVPSGPPRGPRSPISAASSRVRRGATSARTAPRSADAHARPLPRGRGGSPRSPASRRVVGRRPSRPRRRGRRPPALACDGLVKPLSFLTNCSDDARTSSSVAGGSKLNRVLMFRHMLQLYDILAPVAGDVMSRLALFVSCVLASAVLLGAQASPLGDAVRPFVSVDAPVVALTHARVIDGTGAPARAESDAPDQGRNDCRPGRDGPGRDSRRGHHHRPLGQERDPGSRDGARAPVLSDRSERLRAARRQLRPVSISPAA